MLSGDERGAWRCGLYLSLLCTELLISPRAGDLGVIHRIPQPLELPLRRQCPGFILRSLRSGSGGGVRVRALYSWGLLGELPGVILLAIA